METAETAGTAETAETATDPKTIPPAVFQKRAEGNKYILIHKKPIILFIFGDISSACIVLGVILTNYQQIH